MNVPLGRHPNELHMVVTPRKFLCAGEERERREREREREKMGRGQKASVVYVLVFYTVGLLTGASTAK